MTVSLLIVGAGSRGTAYAEHAHHHGAMIAAVAEPREERRLAGVPGFSDWREALDVDCDAVVIATPDREHRDAAIAFARRGRALLIEKPLATTEPDCEAIISAVERAGIICAVAHVLRYTPYTRLLRQLLDDGAIGEIVSVQHLEPVGFWHHAHSYVRGNWRREDQTAPMLLTKCCHDIDWLSYLIGRRCEAVSSFGALTHLHPDRRPAGAAERCLDCALEPTCAFSAPRIYGETAGWPADVVALRPEDLAEALRTGPYGRCVWACDNDVVDHQVVNLRYQGGVTASLTMTAFTRMRDRETRIFGTRGELSGNGNQIDVYDFLTDRTTRHETGPSLPGHGGGDEALMAAFIAAVATNAPALLPTTPAETLESHRIVFAAERARREDRVTLVPTER